MKYLYNIYKPLYNKHPLKVTKESSIRAVDYRQIARSLAGTILSKIIIAALGSLTTIFVISATRVPDHKVVIKYRFNELVEGPVSPGLHFFFPYIHRIEEYDATLRTLTVTDLEGHLGTPLQNISVISGDNYQTTALAYVQYTLYNKHLNLKNGIDSVTLKMVQTYGPKGDTIADKKIQKAIKDRVRTEVIDIVSKYPLDSILSNPKKINNEIFANLLKPSSDYNGNNKPLADAGILINGFTLAVSPSKIYLQRVEAERQQKDKIENENYETALILAKRKRYESFLTNIGPESKAKIEEKKLEASLTNLLSKDAQNRVIVEKFLNKWDGHLPASLVVTNKELSKILGN